MRTFFIAGAPRCGTGWLSALLTTSNSVCLHEGLKFVGGRYTELFQDLGREVCGDAGAHIPFIFGELKKEFPKAHFIIINRDEGEGIRAAFAAGMMPEDSFACYRQIERMAEAVPALKVDFKEIFSLTGARAICDYAGVEFDPIRFNILRRLNIQATESSHNETKEYVTTGLEKVF